MVNFKYYKTYETFDSANKSNDDIIFVEDRKILYTHGNTYRFADANVNKIDVTSANYTGSPISSITLGSGQEYSVIFYNNSNEARTVTINPASGEKTPDGNPIVLTCPAGGYCEVSYVNVGGTIFVRGL